MISIKRWVAALIPMVYALYLPVQSLLIPGVQNRLYEVVALLIYLAAVLPTLILYRGLVLPIWQAAFNLVAAVVLPALIILQRDALNSDDTGGWVVMGTAVILTATSVRQRRVFAVLGVLALVAEFVYVYGPIALFTAGLVGALVFVLAGLGVSTGIQNANTESDKYREREAKSLASIASLEATKNERTSRLQQVLGSSVPFLALIADSKEPLSAEMKQSARLLELALRDEIRGRGLLTSNMRSEISRLRNLGVEVALLDEGGTEGLSNDELDALLAQAIDALQAIRNGRVTIRSPRGETFKVTVVATLPGVAQPLLSLRLS
jgi:hypothetical protein